MAEREATTQWFFDQAVELLPQRVSHCERIVGIGPQRLKISE